MNNSMNTIKVKHIMKVISLLAIVFFFVPTFFVSCSGQRYEMSALKIVRGVSYGKNLEVNSHYAYAVLLILPIIIAVLWLVPIAMSKAAKYGTSAILFLAEIVSWIVLAVQFSSSAKSALNKGADYGYGSKELGQVMGMADSLVKTGTTFWYWVNLALLIIALIIAALLFFGRTQEEASILALQQNVADATSSAAQNVMEMTNAAASRVQNATQAKVGWTCAKCSAVNAPNAKFCTQCGGEKPVEEVPEPVEEVVETEDEQKPEERTCPQCGAVVSENAKFCTKCGTAL